MSSGSIEVVNAAALELNKLVVLSIRVGHFSVESISGLLP